MQAGSANRAELRSGSPPWPTHLLKHPLTAEEALADLPELREGVDSVAPGPGAIYFSRVAAKATKTRIQRYMALPVFQRITVRTWRTCTGLLEKLDEAETV